MIDRDQRTCWAEERERRGLVPGSGDFAGRGLTALLDDPRLLVTTLPADPLQPVVDLRGGDLVGVLPQAFKGITANGVSALAYEARTADTVARYSRIGSENGRWRAFVAVRSDGGVDVAMGSVAGRTYPKDSPLADRLGFRLFVLVHAVRAAIVTQALVCDRVTDLGPFELIVAVHMPEGAILNGFAPGWERAEYAFEVTTALQAHPVIREEVEPWPVDAEGQHDLLVKVAGRICSAFDVAEPRFLPRLGQGFGELSEEYG